MVSSPRILLSVPQPVVVLVLHLVQALDLTRPSCDYFWLCTCDAISCPTKQSGACYREGFIGADCRDNSVVKEHTKRNFFLLEMGRSSLPPGFRFHPTDVELVQYYLKRKIMGKRLHCDAISEVDMYKFAPWDLPEKVCSRSKDLEWYFFCPRNRKYGCGQRVNRSVDIGYWKTTGKDKPVYYDSFIVGMRKTLVFHTGKAPHGERTDWVVHEYMLKDKRLTLAGVSQGSYVLCRLFKKSGLGPKNGEQYGAPFIEEEWEDDTVTDGSKSTPCASFCNQLSAVGKDQPSGCSEGSLTVSVPVEVEDPIERFLSEVLFDEPDPTVLQLPGTSNLENAAGMCFNMYNDLEEPAANHKLSYLVGSSVADPSSSSDRMLEMMLSGLDWEPVTYFPEADQIGEPYLEINDLWSSMGDEVDAEHDHVSP